LLGRYEEAINADLEQLRRNPENTFPNYGLASIFTELDKLEEAQAQIAEVLKKNPQASLKQVRICEPYQDTDILERHIESFRKVGLPN